MVFIRGRTCCHLKCHGGFYFLLKNGDSKVPIPLATYLITWWLQVWIFSYSPSRVGDSSLLIAI